MKETISIKERSDIITSKSNRKYFTIVDMNGRRLISYDVTLHQLCEVGSEIELEVTLGRTPEDTPRISRETTKEHTPDTQNIGEGAARGMCVKELGDMIRAKYLVPLFGQEVSGELIAWYRSEVLGITRVPFDEAKLPNFKKGE